VLIIFGVRPYETGAVDRRQSNVAPIPPLAHHVMLRLHDGRTIARTAAERREVAAIVDEQGGPRGLLVFRLADSHLHVLLATDTCGASAFANYAACALGWRVTHRVPFDRARVRAVADQHHLKSAFRYILRQEQHHGTALDPEHEASSVPDLVGLRVPALDPWRSLRTLLPRVTRAQVLETIGWALLDRWPLLFEPLAEAVIACRGSLRASRCAAVHLAHPSLGIGAVAAALGIHRRSVYRFLAETPDLAHLRAVELQLRLRTQLALRPGTPSPSPRTFEWPHP
jgi:hypothetical protein